ncbi:MAG: serine/threonine protein phosphatase [Xanthobacteraceae bacterium]|nr:serine/threonine protein phosphatase [Xanthobacteraceae bacterium]
MLKVHRRRPSLPEATRIYAVGDIHGRLDLLDALIAAIENDLKRRPVANSLCVFVGDYIDRGAQSRETIDRLIEYGQQRDCVFLRGNHEQLALGSLRDPATFEAWLRVGGREALMSYGIAVETNCVAKQIPSMQAAFHDALPSSHFNFFRKLRSTFEMGDYFFVHAGARPEVDLARQKEEDLLWIRSLFLNSPYDFGKIIVHGHTPVMEVEVRSNRINIDTGAFATGRLTCLLIEGQELALLRP